MYKKIQTNSHNMYMAIKISIKPVLPPIISANVKNIFKKFFASLIFSVNQISVYLYICLVFVLCYDTYMPS